MMRSFVILMILTACIVSVHGDWEVIPVWTGGSAHGISIGPGRDDDTNRLYITHTAGNTVKEFTYDGGWTNTSNIALPFYSEKSLLICEGRNDGISRVYTGEFYPEGNTAEYTWNDTVWDYSDMGGAGQQLGNLVAGNGRNDGVVRLYYSTVSSPPNYVAHEYSYEGAWNSNPITESSGAFMGSCGIDLGDGRNDGINRLYIGLYPGAALGEFTWDGSGWTSSIIAIGLSQVRGVAVGNGRNDDTNRVYVLCRYEGVREYTWNSGDWTLTATILVSGSCFDLDLGQARNDNTNRLYIVTYEGGVYEATYNSGWQLDQIGTPGGNLYRVRIGFARGDDNLRVYVAGSNGIYEYEWSQPGVEEESGAVAKRITAPTIFTDQIQLDLGSDYHGPVEVVIYNTLGVPVYRRMWPDCSERLILSGEMITRLSSGVYFLLVKAEQTQRLKLIKP
jgi:hypothetical protein